jgi:hypothetical protein
VSDLDQKTNKYFPISTSIVIKENENVWFWNIRFRISLFQECY